MTVSELYASVAQLGFETVLEDNERFFYAANRAILRVNAIRPRKGVYVLHHKPPDNLVSSSFEPVYVTEEITYEAYNAKAYYFEADGEGTAFIEANVDGEEGWSIIAEIKIKGNGGFTAYRGFVKRDGAFFFGRIRLRFLLGEYLYSVRSVAIYRYIYSADVSEISAYEQYKRYDLSALAEDFLAPDDPFVRLEATRDLLSDDYDVEDGRVLLLPYNARGLYRLSYLRRPRELVYTEEPAADLTEIPLDEDLCALLPYLIAATVWADDEPDKAQYYMQIYRERAVEVERRSRPAAPARIKSVNNW